MALAHSAALGREVTKHQSLRLTALLHRLTTTRHSQVHRDERYALTLLRDIDSPGASVLSTRQAPLELGLMYVHNQI